MNNPLKFTDPSGYQIRKTDADAWAEAMTDRYEDFMINTGGGSGVGTGASTPHIYRMRQESIAQDASGGWRYDESTGTYNNIFSGREGWENTFRYLHHSGKILDRFTVAQKANFMNKFADKVLGAGGKILSETSIRNFCGINGLTIKIFEESTTYIQSYGIKIKLEYTSEDVNGTTTWKQLITANGETYFDNDGRYYDDDEINDYRIGQTITFFDEPHRPYTENWSWQGVLSLYSYDNVVFSLSYGFNITNGVCSYSPLTIIKK